MVGYNQRKLNILSLGLDGYPLASNVVADILYISLKNASTCLKRYSRMGLFTRDWIEGYYYYYITEQGKERYWYLVEEQSCEVEVLDEDKDNIIDWKLIESRRCPVNRSM